MLSNQKHSAHHPSTTTTNLSSANNLSNTSSVANFTTASVAVVEISTIFIIGFPDDFKERELINMFLFAPGFEGAVLKTTTIFTCPVVASEEEAQRKQLIGFVKFSKASEAIYALEILNGKILDQERGIVLKAEIAKKNLFIKMATTTTTTSPAMTPKRSSPISDEDDFICTCNSWFSNTTPSSNSTSMTPTITNSIIKNRFMSITLPGQADPALITAPKFESKNPIIAEPTPQLRPFSINSSYPSSSPPPPPLLSKSPLPIPDRIIDLCAMQKNLIASPALGSLAAIVGENFPCNTLYVGNLPTIAQEDELRALFRNCLGYRRLSFRPKASGPMCFVEFEDIACATAAMETLYGTMISCSTPVKGGIRLSFSKNPLGLRVASPVSSSTSSNFMEAIGAETDNLDHRQAIATIFTHYYKNNPQRTVNEFRP